VLISACGPSSVARAVPTGAPPAEFGRSDAGRTDADPDRTDGTRRRLGLATTTTAASGEELFPAVRAVPAMGDTLPVLVEPVEPPPPPPPPIPAPVPAAPAPVPFTRGDEPVLGYGSSGPAVSALQVALAQAGYRPDADGFYGDLTADAVLALRKAENLPRSYDVDSDVWARLAAPTGLRPAPTGPNRVEIDLARQVLFIVHNGQVITLNTSTGNNATYTDPETGWDQEAYTPTGQFAFYDLYDGEVKAPLGTLYRPMYFLRGWAVHGSGFVPPWPDSHGCARISYPDVDYLWALGSIGYGSPIVVHETMTSAGAPPATAPNPTAPAAVEPPPAPES
jgi:peptidoglycan hydrolase-like protein with peptidoglycan-binding domain